MCTLFVTNTLLEVHIQTITAAMEVSVCGWLTMTPCMSPPAGSQPCSSLRVEHSHIYLPHWEKLKMHCSRFDVPRRIDILSKFSLHHSTQRILLTYYASLTCRYGPGCFIIVRSDLELHHHHHCKKIEGKNFFILGGIKYDASQFPLRPPWTLPIYCLPPSPRSPDSSRRFPGVSDTECGRATCSI